MWKVQNVNGALSSNSNSYNTRDLDLLHLNSRIDALKPLYKAPVHKDLMSIILFESNEHFSLRIILTIFHVLLIFIFYRIINSFSNNGKPLSIEFRKCFSKWKTFCTLSLICILIFLFAVNGWENALAVFNDKYLRLPAVANPKTEIQSDFIQMQIIKMQV